MLPLDRIMPFEDLRDPHRLRGLMPPDDLVDQFIGQVDTVSLAVVDEFRGAAGRLPYSVPVRSRDGYPVPARERQRDVTSVGP